MLLLSWSLLYPVTPGSVAGLSEAAFAVSFNCMFSKDVLKLPDVSLSAGQTPEPYLTFPKVSAIPGVTPGKDEQC